MSVAIVGTFLSDVAEYFKEMPKVAEHAAMLSLNQTVEREMVPAMRHDMESQVNFPKGYLNNKERFGMSQKARIGNLEVVVTGRDRPTSLARFRQPGSTPDNTRKRGVGVSVKPNGSRHLKRGFLVSLRSGNMGLAIRLKPGEKLDFGKGVEVKAWGGSSGNVYLLYGPSVDQVFSSVAQDALPVIGDKLSNEFYRQFERLSRG